MTAHTNLENKTDKKLPFLSIHDNSNNVFDVGSKEPVIVETYSRPYNDENDAFFLFLEYFLCLLVVKNRIFELMSPLRYGILISDVFPGVYGEVLHHNNGFLPVAIFLRVMFFASREN